MRSESCDDVAATREAGGAVCVADSDDGLRRKRRDLRRRCGAVGLEDDFNQRDDAEGGGEHRLEAWRRKLENKAVAAIGHCDGFENGGAIRGGDDGLAEEGEGEGGEGGGLDNSDGDSSGCVGDDEAIPIDDVDLGDGWLRGGGEGDAHSAHEREGERSGLSNDVKGA